MSCGQRFHLRKYEKLKARADKHLGIAIAKGAKVNTDTLYKSLNVKVPGINIAFPFKPVMAGVDTVYYDRDGVEVKIVYKRDNEGKINAVQPIVRTSTVYKAIRVPYEVKQEIKCEPANRFKWFGIGVFVGASALLAGLVLLKKL